MQVFTFLSSNSYLFSWGNIGCIMTKLEADQMALDLFANGYISIEEFPK